jgi:hypothetical protein
MTWRIAVLRLLLVGGCEAPGARRAARDAAVVPMPPLEALGAPAEALFSAGRDHVVTGWEG